MLEGENHGKDKNGLPQNNFADVKNINDYGRRITLPFVPAQADYSVCADSLEVYIPDMNRTFKTDFRSFIERVNASDDKAQMINLNHLCGYIKDILSFGSDCDFSSTKNEEKNSVYLYPAIDDRMFVASIVIDKAETESMLGNPDPDDYKYNYEKDEAKAKSLYEFLFVDPDDNCSCQHHHKRSQLLEDHLYKRWFDYGTVYGIAAQSIVLLFDGGAMHLVGSFLTIYVRLACLCLAQKASLVLFQKETASLSRRVHEKGSKISVATVTSLMDLQERFSAFESQLCFTEVTPQEQGIEMYEMFTDCFFIDSEMENVKSQIDGLHDATDTYLDFNFNKIALVFTLLGAIYGIEQIITGVMDQDCLTIVGWIAGSIIVGVVIWGFIVFHYRRKFRKKK